MIIVGITGSIGCGKTYLSKIIKKFGFAVYNPDEWVRDMYKKKIFLSLVKDKFPQCFNEYNVFNKRKLRKIVFDDNKQLKKLESIFHPYIRKKFKKIIKKHAETADIIFFDVALLFEMNLDIYCDYVVVADASDQTQMRRVMERDNISEEDFNKIISVQNDKQYTKERADFVINTELSYNQNKVQLIKFIQEILQ